jgi:transposase
MLDALPKAKTLIADRGYDSDWFRATPEKHGTEPCIPPTKSRKIPLAYDKARYRTRHKIENLFAKLKDWRSIEIRNLNSPPHHRFRPPRTRSRLREFWARAPATPSASSKSLKTG